LQTCQHVQKREEKKIAINYGKTKEEINLTKTTKKVTLKKRKEIEDD